MKNKAKLDHVVLKILILKENENQVKNQVRNHLNTIVVKVIDLLGNIEGESGSYKNIINCSYFYTSPFTRQHKFYNLMYSSHKRVFF